MGYLSNFIVYTLAMVGVIAVTLLVFKSTSPTSSKGKTKMLKVLDTLTIAPRKTLYVVSAGGENFLVAGDVGRTTLISKLNGNSNVAITGMKSFASENNPVLSKETKFEENQNMSFRETMNNIPKSSYIDKSNIGIKSSILSSGKENAYTSVIRSLAMKMK